MILETKPQTSFSPGISKMWSAFSEILRFLFRFRFYEKKRKKSKSERKFFISPVILKAHKRQSTF